MLNANLRTFKVEELPEVCLPNSLYFVKPRERMTAELFVTATDRTPIPVTAALIGLSYTHNQSEPEAEWRIVHELGFMPNCQVVDTSGSKIEGTVQHRSLAELIITFSAPFAGVARLN